MNDWENREGLDGRNSASRPKSFPNTSANEFNDPSYLPHSKACPESHDDFVEPLPFFDTEECESPFEIPN